MRGGSLLLMSSREAFAQPQVLCRARKDSEKFHGGMIQKRPYTGGWRSRNPKKGKHREKCRQPPPSAAFNIYAGTPQLGVDVHTKLRYLTVHFVRETAD
jgi:hypothetical protein